MANNHHDTGYKELFSHPEFVQQLIEGFAPLEIARLMDFRTLRHHSGNYITPLFEEKFEDVVWSVDIRWRGLSQPVLLFILLEFQSTVDHRMPIRLLHYVACCYDHLLKTGLTTAVAGLPPVLPIVLYNGNARWTACEDIFEMIRPQPPAFLQVYQPHLRYCLIDEGRYTAAELSARPTPLSGIFQIEQAASPAAMQEAVDRIVALIQAAPDKARIDRIVTRWLKRHLYHQTAGLPDARIDLDQLNSLTEDRAMLAENMEAWIRKEREQGIEQGLERGELMGERKALRRILIRRFGSLPEHVERRLERANSNELARWSDAILDAPTLEAVFNAPH